MNKTNCPHCGLKLGDYMYADACPHCHKDMEHTRRATLSAAQLDPHKARAWPLVIFARLVRLVES